MFRDSTDDWDSAEREQDGERDQSAPTNAPATEYKVSQRKHYSCIPK